MRTATTNGRMTVVREGRHHDVHTAGNGEISTDPTAVLERWDEFRDWECSAGVGMGQTPQRFLRAGEVDVSECDPIGTMRHTMTQPDRPWVWSQSPRDARSTH